MVDGLCILEREKGGVNKVYFTPGGRRALLHFIICVALPLLWRDLEHHHFALQGL